MSDTEYLTATMTTDRTPEQVFEAITDVRGWWSENLIGHSAALHDEFVFTDDSKYAGETARAKQGIRFARFQITEFSPARRVVWHVVDSDHMADPDEWTGTNVIFDISTDAQGTTLHFTHEGLSAGESACFEACSLAWTFFITESLSQLLSTGTGKPIAGYRR
ncbi:SRPBCC family protein [Nocardia wallacei]|uniref:SRPBCC family protein n=1 Tax=Nocardia wallacei TaxID=480035 RepID=UPI00245799DC|nr:SRPBCC domain-containing protein [Nocardia wallacei]